MLKRIRYWFVNCTWIIEKSSLIDIMISQITKNRYISQVFTKLDRLFENSDSILFSKKFCDLPGPPFTIESCWWGLGEFCSNFRVVSLRDLLGMKSSGFLLMNWVVRRREETPFNSSCFEIEFRRAWISFWKELIFNLFRLSFVSETKFGLVMWFIVWVTDEFKFICELVLYLSIWLVVTIGGNPDSKLICAGSGFLND